VPILVRTLGPRDYGAWVLSGGIAGYVLVFDFGLSLTVTRFVARYHESAPKQAEEAITAGLTLLLGVGSLITIATMLAASSWENYLDVPHAGFALRAGGIATLFVLASTLFQSALEGAGIVSATRIVQALGSIVFVAGGIAVVLTTSERLVALSVFLVAQSMLVAAALGFLLILSWGGMPLRWPTRNSWRRVVGYSLTMQGSAIFAAAVDPLSRFLVLVAGGPAAVTPVDIALRARAQLFGSGLAFTRPFLSKLGRLDNLKAGATHADSFWQQFAPVAVSAGLLLSISSYFIVPVLFGATVGQSAGELTAVLTALWLPALTAIVPYLFILLYGTARDVLLIQAINSFVSIGVMVALLRTTPRWAPIIGLGLGSIIATLQTVRTARKRSSRPELFSWMQPGFVKIAICAPILAGLVFLSPGPLYLRCAIVFAIWSALVYSNVRRLIVSAG
jgi:O-antigen/teichoic acid export membrane protein